MNSSVMDRGKNSVKPVTTEGDIPFIDGQNSREEQQDEFEDGNGQASDDVPENGHKPEGHPGEDEFLSKCGSFSFPWLLSVSVVQLAIYLNKLYQDSSAVAVYFDDRDLSYCIVSALCLFVPAFVYIIYMVSIYVKNQEENEAKEIGTRIVNGLLLVPWQIKGRVEVLHFSAQRICQRRKLTLEEWEQKSLLERQASVLEFFEEFYAGFIQLILQLYIIIVSLDKNIHSKALPGEIIASGLTLMSMMAAVKRRDDGILTGTLSMIGWSCIMASRSIAIAMATTVIHGWMILVCILHGAVMSLWLSSISFESFRTNEASSSNFSMKRKFAYFCLIFTVFGLPSLAYWPIMFQLKKKKRPLIFLFVLLVENAAFLALWYFLKGNEIWLHHDHVLVSLMIGGYAFGALLILMYICCKPKRTDEVVYHDIKVENAEFFGMYFEFCDLAFCLPRVRKVEVKLKNVRKAKAPSNLQTNLFCCS